MNEYWTITEVARHYKLRRHSVIFEALFGDLPWTRRGRAMLFHESDVEAFPKEILPGQDQNHSYVDRIASWLDSRGWY